MSEIVTNEAPAPAPKKRKKAKTRRKVAAAKPAAAKPTGEFAGMNARDCPSGCTEKRCVISTVGICAHPFKSAPGGFGPITLANRERARKLIKHQQIDLKG